jgi:hypothetical protein
MEVGSLAQLGNDPHEDALAAFVQDFSVLAIDCNIRVRVGHCLFE